MLSQVVKKLESLDDRLDSVDKTLVKQEANLGEHMRRTELAEQGISELKTEIKPLQTHKAFMEGTLKGIGLIATAVSLIAGIMKIAAYLVH